MASETAFQPPEIWSFRPFFTIQPNTDTRDKQLKAWRDLVLSFCTATKSYHIDPHSFPFFHNDSIGRRLTPEGIQVVIQFLISQGHAEWEDEARSRLRILWKSPQSIATEIYSWAVEQGLNTVYTIYELHSSEEYSDTSFHGTDPALLRRALQVLESQGKCVFIPGETREEDGVKFISK